MLQTLSGWLMTPSALTPHGFCLLWEPWLIWSQVLGDTATGLAYFAIPLALVHFVRRRRDLVFKPVFWLFAVFILLCGTTHWMDLLTIWLPAYRLAAILTLATAAVSIATAAVLWPLVPHLLALPSPAQLQTANEALRESEAGFRLLAEHASDMVSRVGQDGKRRYVSPAAERILGLPPGALVGRKLLDLVRPEDRPALEASTERLLAGAVEEDDVTFRMFRPDGTEIWIEGTAKLLRDPLTGAPDGYISVLRDVTEREAASAALRRLTEDLEGRVREEVAAREAAQVRAAHGERMQALGQLAGGIAHDFNNVLQTVQGSATLIEEQPDDVNGVRDLARMILDAAGRGATVTARLLAFARRADLRAEAVDPRDLLEGLRDILRHTLGAAVAVRVEPAAYGLPPLLADKGQLETAMVNLAANARDAMPGGGVLTLAATAEVVPDGEAHPADLRPGRYLRLSVADTGVGMDAATLARVTEPFFTTKPQGQGTGLGLAMAKGFAEQSGGGLVIESMPGRGTIATIWLPQSTAADCSPRPCRELGRPDTALAGCVPTTISQRVLLVDDEGLVRKVFAIQLQRAGYTVLAAAGGAEALALLNEGQVADVLVSDLTMPGMDGLALIREAQARHPGLPAVLLTGHAGDDGTAFAVNGAASGTFSLLRKPVTAAQLTERLAALLATRTMV